MGTGATDKPADKQEPQEAQGEKKLADLTDDTLVTVKVDGEDVTITWGEAKGGIMRNQKFTKEMQAVRAKEAELDSSKENIEKLREEHAALATILADKKMLTDYVKHQFPDLLPAERREMVKELTAVAQKTAAAVDDNFDPEEIATLGQAKALIEQYQAANRALVDELRAKVENVDKVVKEQVEQRLEEANKQFDRAKNVEAIKTTINDTISKIVSDNPLLKAIPNVEESMRKDVQKLKPKNVEELKEALSTVAHGYREQLEAAVTTVNKKSLVQKEKLTKTTIEPSGGTPVPQKPVTFKTEDGSIDWKKLRELASASMS